MDKNRQGLCSFLITINPKHLMTMATKTTPKTPERQDNEKKKTVRKKSSPSDHLSTVTKASRTVRSEIRTIDQEPGSGGLGRPGIGARED